MTRLLPALPSGTAPGGNLLSIVEFVLKGMCVAALFVQTCQAEEPSATSIIEANCVTCHGQARMSGLDLRDIRGALAGGKRGPAIVPGKADESLLYKAIRRQGELQMPPGKTPLSDADVRIIGDWINAGA